MEYKNDDYLTLIQASIKKINALKEKLDNKNNQEDIAIIGMGCRLPGGGSNPEEFWKFLVNKGDGVIEVPKDRWNIDEFYSDNRNSFGKMYIKEAGFLQNNISEFDAHFFGISPREAVEMDPQQRILLEVAWEALERSGIPMNNLKGSKTGVFVGVIGSEYSFLPRKDIQINPYVLTGSMANIVSGRLSYILGLQGPSISIDTACSSSLTAVHLACESLKNGGSDLALAGGVNLIISPQGFVSLCSLNALAKDGRCKTFDASGDGYGRGEGCGVVVLKRLYDAVKDKDNILAVIKATGMNHDGASSGLTVPNGFAQRDLILKTIKQANVSPEDISYFELHGTGTALGDPIEFKALTQVFKGNRKDPLILGSVKNNIGHLEGAAGIASLIKSVLCIKEKTIPANLHLKNINPRIKLDSIPAILPTESLPWNNQGKKRIMAISSFGFSGTNVSLVLEESTEVSREYNSADTERPIHILALSAKSKKALYDLAKKFYEYLKDETKERIQDICFTMNSGRMHFSCREAFKGENLGSIKTQLSEYISSNSKESLLEESMSNDENNKIAFIFSDKFDEEVGIELLKTQPNFKEELIKCDNKLKELVNISILGKDKFNHAVEGIEEIISFCVQCSILAMLNSFNIIPNVVVGNNKGCLIAAVASKVMDIETALSYLIENSKFKIRKRIKRVLNKPRIRMIVGNNDEFILNSQATSDDFWNELLSKELNSRGYIKNLVDKDYKNFIDFNLNDNSTGYSEIQYFNLALRGNVWNTLTDILSKFYCFGVDINWNEFDKGYIRNKLTLPTYQFQKKKFWCNTIPYGEYLYAENNVSKNLFDGEILKSPFKDKQILYSLSLNKVPELTDTQNVVHVGYFIEFLKRAIKKIYNKEFYIKKFEFISALIISKDITTDLSLILSSKDDNEIEFCFYSSQGDDNWTNTSKGIVGFIQENEKVVFSDFEIDIKERCSEKYSQDEFYDELEKRNMHLGESVKWIGDVWRRDNEALAMLISPKNSKGNTEYDIGININILDSCAQLFHAALPKQSDPLMRYMVSKWEDFKINNVNSINELWCHVTIEEIKKNELKGKFRLYNQDGVLISEISSGLMKGLSKEHDEALKKILESKKQNSNLLQAESAIIKILKQTDKKEWIEIIINYLLEIFASIFLMNKEEINIKEPLIDLGLDSIVSIEVKGKIESELKIFLPIETLIEGPSILELSEVIMPLLSIDNVIENAQEKEKIQNDNKNIGAWIMHRKANLNAKIKLFCFPYGSGGGASIYRNWHNKLPDFIEICPIQLPGKENRIKEDAFRDINTAVDTIKEIILPELDRPYAFYGHSMGALIAYKLAYDLKVKNNNGPNHLFVGAYSSPTIIPNPLILMTKERFRRAGYTDIPKAEELKSMNSEEIEKIVDVITSKVDKSRELVRLYLSTRLSELEMVQSHKQVGKEKFDIPITAFYGKSDDKVKYDEMIKWNDLTTEDFKINSLPGDHLFLKEDQSEDNLLELMGLELKKYK
ncbi:beta-ketoacyl synthase N-terminal-like domain-containing protein [Clostridium beijerinckii]|uniref:Acyl transferase domain-containing protein n=1 Tax=Clostridium beijerinckii TaxID=1520 RepID=A0AAX0AUX2_CLOBE|nr:beta-ketoacyl synthase N-terminal-like domain-containing protein [Clostridium beijerinckii]NRT86795.1 acyl transferase domain-containing protein [Clostridium beijerinckii]NYC72227.1 acyl transferase domain-containing protein [Clostridium beijerinckii]